MGVYALARSGRRDDVVRSSCYGCWLGACHEVGVERSAAIAKLGAPRAVVTSGCLEHQTSTPPLLALTDCYHPASPTTGLFLHPTKPTSKSPSACRKAINTRLKPHSSRLHHVQKQLRQRFRHFLASGPNLPGRICFGSGQAGFRCSGPCQQDTRCARSYQGTFKCRLKALAMLT
jgi:hypothetical protein